MMSPEDAGAMTRLKRLNEQIQEQNLKEKKNPHDFLIKYEIFIAHFVMVKPYYESLQKNPDDEHARKKMMVVSFPIEVRKTPCGRILHRCSR